MSDQTELIGGQEKREIRIVAYDPAWVVAFQRERRRIVDALGSVARRVDHVGSTAVPGLVAKPIIDIDLSVPDADDEDTYLADLESAGYVLRVRQPGHRMMRTPDLSVQVHICTAGSEWERRHLLFRDWLRQNATDRAAYGRHKLDLAEQDWPDMNAYAAAKGSLIAEISERAEAWAAATGWTPGT